MSLAGASTTSCICASTLQTIASKSNNALYSSTIATFLLSLCETNHKNSVGYAFINFADVSHPEFLPISLSSTNVLPQPLDVIDVCISSKHHQVHMSTLAPFER